MSSTLHGVYIGQCLSELKQIYHGNKKLLIYATKHLFTISNVYFYVALCDLATTYYRVSRISLPLKTVRSKFKVIKQIVHDGEDFWMSCYKQMLNDILSLLLKHALINVFFSVVRFTIAFVSFQELNDLGYPIHLTRDLSPCLFNTFSIRNVAWSCNPATWRHVALATPVHKTILVFPLRYNHLFYMSLELSVESQKF